MFDPPPSRYLIDEYHLCIHKFCMLTFIDMEACLEYVMGVVKIIDAISFNPLADKLFNLNFYPLEVVSR